jgi:hypothetical protein
VPEEVGFIITFSPRRRVERRRSRGMPSKSAASACGVRRRHSHRSPSCSASSDSSIRLQVFSGCTSAWSGYSSLSSSARRASPNEQSGCHVRARPHMPERRSRESGTLATATFENDLVTLSTLRYVDRRRRRGSGAGRGSAELRRHAVVLTHGLLGVQASVGHPAWWWSGSGC